MSDNHGRPGTEPPPAGREQASGLLAQLEQNLAEHVSHLHRGTPGMSVRGTGDVVIADSGLDDHSFNTVTAARFPAAAAAARIRQTIRDLTALGRPFAWHVGPASSPADLAARLIAAGLPDAGREAAMWAPLAVLPDGGAGPELEIRPVTTAGQRADYAAALAEGDGPSAVAARRFLARTTALALAPG